MVSEAGPSTSPGWTKRGVCPISCARLRPRSSAWRWLSLPCVLTWSPGCVWVLISSSSKDTSPTGLGPIFMTSFLTRVPL
jgi:hypothetical protein